VSAFDRLQAELGPALAATGPGSSSPHVIVSLPSHSMPQRLLDHHASHLPGLEHRALLDGLHAARSPGARVVVVTSAAPSPAVLDYYAHLARPDAPDEARRRISCLVVPDDGARGIAAKLLDRPDLLADLRRRIDRAPAVIEPWNVTGDEVAVALALGVPVNGGPPELWSLGFKSASRRLFRQAGVPVPAGVEDVHDPSEVAAAVIAMRRERPLLDRVVVKLDNSGAGEGNRVVHTRSDTGHELTADQIAEDMARGAPAWFLRDLVAGGVVEELVSGRVFASPSAQVEMRPDGGVVVRATHEQVLGGESGQVFVGSRFPADPSYAAALADHTAAVGRRLAELGAVGWASVDFVARREGALWELAAVDLNLRKGGTSHSYAALQHLVPGSYDLNRACWVADADGSTRCYRSSDAVAVPRGPDTSPSQAIASLAASGLAYDHRTGTGVVLHMFSSLTRDSTLGATAIGRTATEAERLFDAVPDALAVRPPPPRVAEAVPISGGPDDGGAGPAPAPRARPVG
jgi:pheganomycin biosynthesis PGM1-like protein